MQRPKSHWHLVTKTAITRMTMKLNIHSPVRFAEELQAVGRRGSHWGVGVKTCSLHEYLTSCSHNSRTSFLPPDFFLPLHSSSFPSSRRILLFPVISTTLSVFPCEQPFSPSQRELQDKRDLCPNYFKIPIWMRRSGCILRVKRQKAQRIPLLGKSNGSKDRQHTSTYSKKITNMDATFQRTEKLTVSNCLYGTYRFKPCVWGGGKIQS